MIQASLSRDKSNSLATFPMSVLKNPANELCGLVHLSTHGHSVHVGLFTRCPLLVWATELRVNSFLVHKLCLEHKNKLALEKKMRTIYCFAYWIPEVAWLVIAEYLLKIYTPFLYSSIEEIFVELCSQQALN